MKFVAGVQIIPQGARMLACPFFGGHCGSDPVHSARAHCRGSNASVQEHKLCESHSTFYKSGFSGVAEQLVVCHSVTDHGENVEVIQLVRVAVEQIVAFPMPQIMGKSRGFSNFRYRLWPGATELAGNHGRVQLA